MLRIRVVGLSLAGVLIAGGVFAGPGGQGTKPATPSAATPAATPAPVGAQTGTHVMVVPKDLKWADAPPSLPKGAKVAVLEGDPTKEGPFTMRAEVPAKYKIMPHWHPAIEHVTVISGELYMGAGETLDEKAAMKLVAGGFAVMPVKHVHYAFTKGKKATIQIHGIGPWGITYVNPADDPRNAAASPAK